jgi:hypothetical protein
VSATARASGSPERRGASGPVRVPRATASRTGTHRTGTLRTGTYRTGVVRGGAARTAATPSRSVGHRATPTQRSVPVRADLRLVSSAAPGRDRGSRGRSRRLPVVLLVLGLLVGTTLSLLVLNTAIAVDSLRATSLRQQNDHREQELQRLQQEVVDGSTVQKLAGEAARAGLVPAGTAGYLVVEPDGSSTFRGTPAPATAPPAPAPQPGTQPDQAQTGGN